MIGVLHETMNGGVPKRKKKRSSNRGVFHEGSLTGYNCNNHENDQIGVVVGEK